jgi:hypothetical protein
MNTSTRPSFSVVIATRNRAHLVVPLVQRLRGMPDGPEEVVVVDDGSTDTTSAQLASIEPPLVLTRTEGDGPATARSVGAALACGDWLVFVDDDDEPGDAWMTTFRTLVGEHPDAEFVSVGFARRWGGATTPSLPRVLGPAFSGVRANYLAGTFAISSRLFEAVGGFTPGLRCMEFTDLAMRAFDHVTAAGSPTAATDRTTITIEVRPPAKRGWQAAETLEAAWQLVFARNAQRFRRDHRFLADQHSTIGVAWARAGRSDRARRHLWRALRVDPRPARLARYIAIATPLLRRRAWPPLAPPDP